MKTFLRILLGIAVVIAVAVTAIIVFTAGDRAIARGFVEGASTGAYAEARALMHEDLQRQFPEARFAEIFDGTRPYTQIGFNSVETSGGITRLQGVAETGDGCASTLEFEILRDRIIAFNITPLCR